MYVAELARVGLKATSLDADSLSDARKNNISLLRDVAECKYSLVAVSPERLTSPEFGKILACELLRKSLVLYAIDEAHVVVPWSKLFRKDYGNISKARTRIPLIVPLLAMTATSQQGDPETNLIRLLGFRNGFKTIRLLREQKNLQLVYATLTHTLGLAEFSDIAWVAEGKYKTIIYCSTIEMCDRVASYLWKLRPATAPRYRNIRVYSSFMSSKANRQTIHDFDNNPDTFVIIATVKLALGVDVRKAQICMNLGLPETVEQDTQQKGRAGRDRTIDAVGITYVEKRYTDAVRKEWEAENADPDERPKNPPQIGKDIDPGLRRLVRAHVSRSCLNAESNRIFGESSPTSCASCSEAQRRLPCSSCIYRPPFVLAIKDHITAQIRKIEARAQMDNNEPAPLPVRWKWLADRASHKALTAEMRVRAGAVVDRYSRSRWLTKTTPYHHLIPYTAHIPGPMFNTLLDQFHLIRTRKALDEVLAGWTYLEDDGDCLFTTLETHQKIFDAEHIKAAALKAAKTADTKKRHAAAKEVAQVDVEAESQVVEPTATLTVAQKRTRKRKSDQMNVQDTLRVPLSPSKNRRQPPRRCRK
ncbi:hypothetical protein EUX98_g6232 [Antrodiella citrinella]|uniref:DNA 3'-5' helicase n=1 Tax=Antrodiella citrinella TaxID=2447956 RepID=A0A4S4MRP8_9APHY|nr:hypothetical protein EUX98_g6232 [Antrodiella citrinella]